MTMHEAQPPLNLDGTWREHRFYMVGKLVRQDLLPPEDGYRETLVCPCHVEALQQTYVKVFGPLKTEPHYSAHCSIDGEQLAEANTMEELWSAVEQLEERKP